MYTNDNNTYDINGDFKSTTGDGVQGAYAYYVASPMPLISDTLGWGVVVSPFFMAEVVTQANKHRKELRANAMAVYGD